MNAQAESIVASRKPKVNPLPPREYLNECFEYNPETGELKWKRRPREHFASLHSYNRWHTINEGKMAGYKSSKSDGRRACIFITMSSFKGTPRGMVAHRVIYSMLGIEVPEGMEIDHKNRDPWDNRFENLRLATSQQNCFNRKRRRDKVDGLPKGVRRGGKKFYASISLNGKETYLGRFLTAELAAQAYREAATKHYGEFAS